MRLQLQEDMYAGRDYFKSLSRAQRDQIADIIRPQLQEDTYLAISGVDPSCMYNRQRTARENRE